MAEAATGNTEDDRANRRRLTRSGSSTVWVMLLLVAKLTGRAAPGDKKWDFTTGGAVRSSPALGTNGLVYFGSSDKKVYAVEAATGNKRWQFIASVPFLSSPSIGPDGTVYIGSSGESDGTVFALDGEAGTRKWSRANLCPIYSSPTLGANGLLYVSSSCGVLHALNAATGVKQWDATLEAYTVYSSPIVGPGGTVFYGAGQDNRLYAIDGDTGRQRWNFTALNAVQSSVAIGADGTVFIGSYDKFIYALDSLNGAKKWEHLTGDSISSSAALGPDGTLYVGANDGRLYAIDSATGAEKWNFLTGDTIHSSPAVASDGTVYFGSYDKSVYALDGGSGAENWSFATGGLVLSSPVIDADGTVFIGSFDGKLYAFEGGAAPAQTIWPTFKGDARRSGSAEIDGPPEILQPPRTMLVPAGTNTLLNTVVRGRRPMFLQWLFNGQPIANATNAFLDFNRAQVSDTGEYTVVARNAKGEARAASTLSVGFILEVKPQGGGEVTRNVERAIYLPGAIVELKATPLDGRKFLGWRGDASGFENPFRIVMDHHKRVAAKFELRPGEKLWEFTLPGGYSITSPVIGEDGTVFVGTATNIFALNGETGLLRWESGTGRPIWLTLDTQNNLIAGTGDRLVALDAATGAKRWQIVSDNFFTGAYALVNEMIYLTMGSRLLAYDAMTGQHRWTYSSDRAITSAIAAGQDGNLFIATEPGQVQVVGGANGQRLQTFDVTTNCCINLLVPAPNHRLLALTGPDLILSDTQSGQTLWRSYREGLYLGSPLIGSDGTIISKTSDGFVRGMDLATGQFKWEHELGRQFSSDDLLALAADGTLYLSSSFNELVALDLASNRKKWTTNIGGALAGPPAISPDGLVLCVSYGQPASSLVAIMGTAPLADEVWPKARGNERNTNFAGDNPPAIKILRAEYGTEGFTLRTRTRFGHKHYLEFKNSINDLEWQGGASLQGQGGVQVLTDTTTPEARRFYRVRIE